MKQLSQKELQHLFWRAGFGISYQEFSKLKGKSCKKVLDKLFIKAKKHQTISIDTSYIPENYRDLSPEEKQKVRQQNTKEIRKLANAWIERMSKTDGVLHEKMVLFWANHFACRTQKPDQLNSFFETLNTHALGNFSEFVLAIAQEPAMLNYLNNKQNRKKKPNENFARELMELFTIGRGNYTEDDIKESARAFTGWTEKKGEFVIIEKFHDNGSKTFMGHTGNFDGGDIIKILLKDKRTAQFVCSKVYKHFVNETYNAKHINEMADVFYKEYSIAQLMRFTLSQDWFYAQENIGVKIKSPIDLLVGLNRQFHTEQKNENALLFVQRMLGQQLFYPPNVAGWPGGKNWIDSSTMMYRLRLASVLLNDGEIDIDVDETMMTDAEEAMMMVDTKPSTKKSYMARRLQSKADWDSFLAELPKGVKKEALVAFFIQPPLAPGSQQFINRLDAANLKSLSLDVLSLPEYQLC